MSVRACDRLAAEAVDGYRSASPVVWCRDEQGTGRPFTKSDGPQPGSTASREILPSVVNHGLKRLLPLLIENPISLQAADATSLPGLLNGGRIDAEFEHRHCLLRSLGQHAIVFVLQLFFDPLGETPNFSLCRDREGLRLKEPESSGCFVSNGLESLQNFRACHDGLSCRSEKGAVFAMVSRDRERSRVSWLNDTSPVY